MTDVYGTQESVVVELSRADLTKIKGIGTTTAEKLYNAKIVSVRQIAEMTPERLSETPGIGLATATKFITAAKNYLESSQKESDVSETTQIPDAMKKNSVPDSIEKYEVEEVIVDVPEEINEDTIPELEEAFYQSQTEAFEEEEKVISIEPKTIQLANSIEFDTQPEIEQENEYEEEKYSQEIIPEIQIQQNQPESKSSTEEEPIESNLAEQKNVNFESFRDSTFENIVSDTFKDVGCYEIPSSLESLNQFTKNLDYLGCRLVEASDNLIILFLFPVKRFDAKGTVLVGETKIESKAYPNNRVSGVHNDVKLITQNLLQIRDKMQENVLNGTSILQFFQKYLQLDLRSEKNLGNKNLVFLSGTTQYKVVIEPILVCNAPPKSMEKSLVFPYQRTSNLHAVVRSDLPPLVKFLEKKYKMIEKRTKKTSSIKDYRKSEVELSSRVRYISIPIFGYSVALLVLYFAKIYFLLRLFNTIGFAVLGIYLSLLAFLYFKAYKTKKEFKVQFKTPYYQQTLEFSEIDLLDLKEELTDELITQFGYECLGKEASYGVIERVEAKSLKNNIDAKRSEPKLKSLFETEQVETQIATPSPTKYGGKYSSFLED